MDRGLILNRPLKRRWLDVALAAARTTRDVEERRRQVLDDLSQATLGTVAVGKTLSVLTRIWLNPSLAARAMIEWAIAFDQPVDTRVLHVGAMLATHPFIGDIYSVVGKALSRTGEVHNAEIRLRTVDLWGDREAVAKATVMALNTLESLKLLQRGRTRTLRVAGEATVVPGSLSSWVGHALLLTRRADSVDVRLVGQAPELFALSVPHGIPDNYPLLERHTEGSGRVVVAERRFVSA